MANETQSHQNTVLKKIRHQREIGEKPQKRRRLAAFVKSQHNFRIISNHCFQQSPIKTSPLKPWE